MRISKVVSLPLLAVATIFFCGIFYVLSPPNHRPRRVEIPENIDFGEVERNRPVSQQFWLKNISQNNIEFNFSGDCECVQFNPAKGSIPPQSQLAINVTFIPTGDDLNKLRQAISQMAYCETMENGKYESQPITLRCNLFSPLIYDQQLSSVSGYAFATKTHAMTIALNETIKSIAVHEFPNFIEDVQIGEIHPVFRGLDLRLRFKSLDKPQLVSGQISFALELEEDGNSTLSKMNATIPIQYTAVSPLRVQPSQIIAADSQDYRAFIFSNLDNLKIIDLEILRSSAPEFLSAYATNPQEVKVCLEQSREKVCIEQIACRATVLSESGEHSIDVSIPVMILAK